MEVAFADREPPCQAGNAVAIDDAVRDQPHRPADEVAPHIPFRRTGRRVRTAALAGAKASELSRCGCGVEPDVVALRSHRRRAARAAVDAGRRDGRDEPAVEARVAALDGPIAAFEVVRLAGHKPYSDRRVAVPRAEKGESGGGSRPRSRKPRSERKRRQRGDKREKQGTHQTPGGRTKQGKGE